jgi:tetratricopeptide (TPR) repeat protein
MKSSKKIALLLTAVLYLVSCTDDFLDTKPTAYLSSDDLNEMLQQNPTGVLEPLILGIYSTTFSAGSGGIHGSSRNDQDYGQKNIDLCTDMMCGDIAGTAFTYGWYAGVARFTDQLRTGTMPYMAWRFYYRLIKSANEVLDLLGSDEDMPEDEIVKAYYGQAKAVRAYAYFYLVNLYQHPYSDKQNKPGVPIYRTQLGNDVFGQSSVEEVYERIVKDLEDAVVALKDFKRGTDKSRINQDVAYGLLANAYLFIGEYEKAAEAADAVISKKSYPILPQDNVLTTGFNSLADSRNWMWGIDLTTENTTALVGWWGHVDVFTYGYASASDYKAMDSILYASIPASDIRREWFGSYDETSEQVEVGASPLIPVNKFYDPNRVFDGDKTWTNDYVYMRIEELHLIKAEALARANQVTEAGQALKELLDERNPSYSPSTDQAALLDEIYFNWRVEMWGEGKSYLAMKRFKATKTRANNHAYLEGNQFAYNYERMIFEIPEMEWLNNPYLVPQQ